LGVEVVVVERGWGGEAGEAEPAEEAAGLGGVDFDRQEPLEGGGH
jgi:hypothetical protein